MTNEIIMFILLILAIIGLFKLVSMLPAGESEFEIKVWVCIVLIIIIGISFNLLGIDIGVTNWSGFFLAAFTFCLGLLFGHGRR